MCVGGGGGGGGGAKLGLNPKTIKYSPFHLKDNMLSLSINFFLKQYVYGVLIFFK